MPPTEEELFRGIDVSEFQGEIDFESVAGDGVRAVYIRAGVGGGYTDPYFHENYEKAKRAGLYVGFYHYVTARSVEEGRAQGEFFASLLTGREIEMRSAMDFENFGSLSVSEINEISEAYLEALTENSRREAVIYSDTSNAQDIFSRSLAERYPLWVAQYGVSEPSPNGKWDSWAGFQYTDVGRVAGIRGNVDRDFFNAEIFVSDREAIPGEKKIPRRADRTVVIITVRPGDTLYAIAREYGTTVEAIARENDIDDPNLIFAGQRLRIVLPARTGRPLSYTVRRGDTLTKIAGRFGVSVSAIRAVNGIENPNKICAGEVLEIPAAKKSGTYYRVRPGDTINSIAAREKIAPALLTGINDLPKPDLIRSGQELKLSEELL